MKNNSLYFRPALFAGLIMAIINFAPGLDLVNCFCCAGLFIGGVLAVFFFRMDTPPDHTIMNIDGFYLGLWTGIFAAGFETVLNITIGPFIADIKFQMLKNILKRILNGTPMPSGLMDQLSQAIAAAKRPGLLDTLLSFFLVVVVYSIFTIFGALLTTAFIQKRKSKQA
ncbi:MAG TPA: hypothetical protein PL001_02500 [Candidatus Kryptobacter bacterium]|nr:MAG: hypothetical protein B7Z63_00770 [Ignavibacteriae bacterium 37-53-5]HQT90881.1 hypothetical protein [Candidatus Kryptobacter bacterium]